MQLEITDSQDITAMKNSDLSNHTKAVNVLHATEDYCS
jgi:hypothetical protein|tara:strand:+ start:148 stop:261 length:114 start_codon:yes stop_codon:yes gene_type:complete